MKDGGIVLPNSTPSSAHQQDMYKEKIQPQPRVNDDATRAYGSGIARSGCSRSEHAADALEALGCAASTNHRPDAWTSA